mmetsp:Transcript_38655/g.97822  ORF Transcript_38655/g.97822 Transcript_38655/m.97822 type:complete len:283 (+) Transcript_38655:221-1069(+)
MGMVNGLRHSDIPTNAEGACMCILCCYCCSCAPLRRQCDVHSLQDRFLSIATHINPHHSHIRVVPTDLENWPIGGPITAGIVGRFGNLRVCFGEKWQDSAWASNAGVSCFLNSRPDDVHVFNFGLWHNNPLGVPNAVGYMIRFLQDSARARKQAPPHLVWSESLPQHFKAPGGLYHDDTSKIKPGCMQTAHHEKLSNFRNKLTLPMLDNSSLLDVAPVHVFRGWRLLAGYPRSHNHKVDSKLDCTHWCQYDGSVLSAVVHILLSDISRAFWGRSWGSDAATK